LRQPLTERYRERLAGVLSCYDRIIVTGTLPGACYAKGMTRFLSARQIRIFDYPRFAEPLRDRVPERAAELASAAGITIEHITKNHIRKEDVVATVLVVRGDRPGLVHIISAMEACDTSSPASSGLGGNGAFDRPPGVLPRRRNQSRRLVEPQSVARAALVHDHHGAEPCPGLAPAVLELGKPGDHFAQPRNRANGSRCRLTQAYPCQSPGSRISRTPRRSISPFAPTNTRS